MASMNVSVPDPMRAWVQSRIDAGQYASVSDYVRDLIRRDQSRTAEQEQWLTTMDSHIAASLADAEAGRVVEADALFDRLDAKFSAMSDAAASR